MLKKATIAFSSSCAVHSIGVPTSVATTSRCRPQPERRSRRSTIAGGGLGQPQFRSYSMVVDGTARDAEDGNIPWPEVTTANAVPTPYQIFNQSKGAPYSKKRFYELVKIYHPDRHSHCDHIHDNISAAVKLERYRLVVAANNILSDPIKRGAYDTYGAGWHGAPGIVTDNGHSTHGSWAGGQARGWDTHNGPSGNATWEDWERWYNKDAKQEPIYLSNGAFFTIILFLMGAGYLVQTARFDKFSLSLTHQIDKLHGDMSRDLVTRRKNAMNASDKDVRIQEFLKARDPKGYRVTDLADEKLRKMLPEPEICQSGNIVENATNVDYFTKNVNEIITKSPPP